MLCSACRKPVEQTWKRCPECMTKIQSTRCRTCNELLIASWKCCPHCDDADGKIEGAVADETLIDTSQSDSEGLRSWAIIRHDGGFTSADQEETLHNASDQDSDILLPQPILRGHTNRQDGGVVIYTREVAEDSKPKEKDEHEPLTTTIVQYLRGFEDGYKQYGIEMVFAKVKKDLKKWKNVPLKIIVTGESGVGKSSFINAMLGLKRNDTGAAPIGITETTKEIHEYPHPKYSNFVLVDVPGVGTPNFPKDNYSQILNLKDCDLVIIISGNRFKENDAWLANETRKAGKRFYFVRAKIDQDIKSEKENSGLGEEEVVKTVADHCKQELTNLGFEKPDVFIISNSKEGRDKFDLKRLMNELITGIPALKKEAMILSLSLMIQPVFDEKKTSCLERIDKVATGASSQIFSEKKGFNMLKDECWFYQEQFGVSEDSLASFASELGIDSNTLKKTINLRSTTFLQNDLTFKAFCLRIPQSEKNIPVKDCRSRFEKFISDKYYSSFCYALYELLMMCYEESQKILQLFSTFDI